MNQADMLSTMAENNRNIKERAGSFCYEYFEGIPHYGDGVEISLSSDICLVKDYGTCPDGLTELTSGDLIFFIFSGSDWDMSTALALGEKLSLLEQSIFICNYHNRKAAKKFARIFGKKVYCFPYDENPYHVTSEKERLISAILHQKGGNHHFSFW